MQCRNCGRDSMYDRWRGKKCYNCGWKWVPTTGLLDERPTKPHDAVCGELVTDYPVHDDTYPRMVNEMCNDGSKCKFNPTTMTETGDGQWLAVCTTHAKS